MTEHERALRILATGHPYDAASVRRISKKVWELAIIEHRQGKNPFDNRNTNCPSRV